MSAAGPSGSASAPAMHTTSDAEDSIALGSEDSDTDSTDSEEDSSQEGSSEEGTISLEEESDGGVPIVEDEDDNWEDNADEDEQPNYGHILEGDRGYVHPDGHEETWYKQKVPGDPDAPGWTTINSGLRDNFAGRVIVNGEELAIAAASAKAEIEENESRHLQCNCSSIQLPRIYDDLPYFNHDNGYWIDPAVKNPRRTIQPFDPDTTRVNAEKARKRKHDGDSAANADDDFIPTTLSSEVTVPQCDLHFPVTGVLDEDWKFLAGSRYVKQRMYYDNPIEDVASLTNDDNLDLDSESSLNLQQYRHLRHKYREALANAADADVENTYIQYVDQAHLLRLIEEDYKNPACRKMNMHAPPRKWDCAASVAKLNRWMTNFRERRSAAEMAAREQQQREQQQQQQEQEKPAASGVYRKHPWSTEELEAVRDSMVQQLRETGRYKIPLLLDVLQARWPDKKRTRQAVLMTLSRYGLARHAREIAYGEEEGEKEQGVEEADDGEADREDNDDDEVEVGGEDRANYLGQWASRYG